MLPLGISCCCFFSFLLSLFLLCKQGPRNVYTTRLLVIINLPKIASHHAGQANNQLVINEMYLPHIRFVVCFQ